MYKKEPPGSPTGLYHCPDCNVILITMTNLRYDHMSENGYFRPTTPNIDALAGGSLVFDNAFAHASWTLPESMSIYTGLYPYQHGVMKRNDGSTLSKTTPTLIDYLNRNGYITAAFTGGFDYNPAFGATGRFQTYEECASGQGVTYPRQDGPRGTGGTNLYGGLPCTVPKAISWLKQNSQKKFFLQVQGFDAHCPFGEGKNTAYDPQYQGTIDFTTCLWTLEKTAPTILNGKTYYSVFSADTDVLMSTQDITHLIALYDGSITTADAYVGQLLQEVKILGLSGKTIIIFTSEHGDMLGKDGMFMRGGPMQGTFFDDVLHIPLIMKLPNVPASRLGELAAHIDVMPTIMDILGIRMTSPVEGKSLLPLVFGTTPVHDYVFAGSFFSPLSANPYTTADSSVDVVRSLDWKLIRETVWDTNGQSKKPTVTETFYDIKNDRDELHDVSGVNRIQLTSMKKIMEGWIHRIKPTI
jgi:arylsulfatase A-like enzyme